MFVRSHFMLQLSVFHSEIAMWTLLSLISEFSFQSYPGHPRGDCIPLKSIVYYAASRLGYRTSF